MGTWGPLGFENDAALDWLSELEADGVVAVRRTLESVVETGGYIDADDAHHAIAAAEVVAAARGIASEELPDEVRTWLEGHAKEIGDRDVVLARKAVQRVRDGSELQELWAEDDPENEWSDEMKRLLARLKAEAKPRTR